MPSTSYVRFKKHIFPKYILNSKDFGVSVGYFPFHLGVKSQLYDKQLMNITKNVKKEPGIHIVSVSHDNWCKKLKNNKKECNCNHDVAKQIKE